MNKMINMGDAGNCVKSASRWDCITCNLVCKDRVAMFDIEAWKNSKRTWTV